MVFIEILLFFSFGFLYRKLGLFTIFYENSTFAGFSGFSWFPSITIGSFWVGAAVRSSSFVQNFPMETAIIQTPFTQILIHSNLKYFVNMANCICTRQLFLKFPYGNHRNSGWCSGCFKPPKERDSANAINASLQHITNAIWGNTWQYVHAYSEENPFNCKKSYKHHLQNPVSLKCSLCFQNERSAVAIYRQFSAKFDGGGNSLFGDLEKSETFQPNFSWVCIKSNCQWIILFNKAFIIIVVIAIFIMSIIVIMIMMGVAVFTSSWRPFENNPK